MTQANTRSEGFFSHSRQHLRRTLSVDLSPGALSHREETALGQLRSTGAASAPFERLLLWRRSVLFVAFLVLVPTTAIELVKAAIELSDPRLGAYGGLLFLLVLCNVALVVGVLVAHRRWAQWAASRRVLFWTWVIAFAAPFAVALFPLRALATNDGQLGALGFLGALGAVMQLAPKALALIPGVLRAAVGLKVLFPSASAPGWLIRLGAPFYLLLVFIVLVMPFQLSGSVFLLLALVAYAGAPIWLFRSATAMTEPVSVEEAVVRVRRTRGGYIAFNAVGSAFLIGGLVDVVVQLDLNPLDGFLPLLTTLANILVLSVVAMDATCGALSVAAADEGSAARTAAAATTRDAMATFTAAAGAGAPSDGGDPSAIGP